MKEYYDKALNKFVNLGILEPEDMIATLEYENEKLQEQNEYFKNVIVNELIPKKNIKKILEKYPELENMLNN